MEESNNFGINNKYQLVPNLQVCDFQILDEITIGFAAQKSKIKLAFDGLDMLGQFTRDGKEVFTHL